MFRTGNIIELIDISCRLKRIYWNGMLRRQNVSYSLHVDHVVVLKMDSRLSTGYLDENKPI